MKGYKAQLIVMIVICGLQTVKYMLIELYFDWLSNSYMLLPLVFSIYYIVMIIRAILLLDKINIHEKKYGPVLSSVKAPKIPVQTVPVSNSTKADELIKFRDLYESGAITEDEFIELKKQLIEKI